MKLTSIGWGPIYKRFLWIRWIDAWRITITADEPCQIRLQRRDSGLTKNGNPYAWRPAGDSPFNITSWSFEKCVKRPWTGRPSCKTPLAGLNDFRGQGYNKTAKPTHFYGDIITLDFGKK